MEWKPDFAERSPASTFFLHLYFKYMLGRGSEIELGVDPKLPRYDVQLYFLLFLLCTQIFVFNEMQKKKCSWDGIIFKGLNNKRNHDMGICLTTENPFFETCTSLKVRYGIPILPICTSIKNFRFRSQARTFGNNLNKRHYANASVQSNVNANI